MVEQEILEFTGPILEFRQDGWMEQTPGDLFILLEIHRRLHGFRSPTVEVFI